MHKDTASRGTFSDLQIRSLLPILLVLAALAVSALVGFRYLPSSLLALLVGLLGLVLLLREPAWGLVAMAVLSIALPFQLRASTWVSLTLPVFLIPAIAVAWVLNSLRRGAVRLPASPTTLPLLLFVGSGLLSLFAGRVYWDPLVPQADNLLSVQLGQWAIFALSAAIFLLAGHLGTREPWLRVATFAFLCVGGIVVMHWFVGPLWRVLNWAQTANSAAFWAWLGGMTVGQLLFNRRLPKAARLGLLALLLAAAYVVWIPQSAWVSGWVPFTVSVLAVVLLRAWWHDRRAAVLLVVALLLVAVVFFPFFFEHAGGERSLETSGGGRLLLYRATLDLVKGHPLLGLGPAAYRHYAFTNWLSAGVGRALWVRPNVASHNNYIDVYAQMGLIGLGFFVWFLFATGKLGLRLCSRFRSGFAGGYAHGAIGGLAGSMVAMLLADSFLPYVYNVGFGGFRTTALAWMFLGGLVALEQSEQ